MPAKKRRFSVILGSPERRAPSPHRSHGASSVHDASGGHGTSGSYGSHATSSPIMHPAGARPTTSPNGPSAHQATGHGPKTIPAHIIDPKKSPQPHPKMDKARQQLLKRRESTLQKHRERAERHKPKKKIDYKKWAKWIGIVVVLLIAWWLINKIFGPFDIKGMVESVMQLNPTVWQIYKTISDEIGTRSLLGLFYASVLSTFFLTNVIVPIPPEVIFIEYLRSNIYFIQVITIMLIGNMISMAANWFLGWLIGERSVKFFMKSNYKKFKQKLNKAGVFIILFGNIIPFPMEPFAVFLGAVRYPFKKYITFTLIGRVCKFLLLAFFFFVFIKYATPYINQISGDWFADAIKSVFVL